MRQCDVVGCARAAKGLDADIIIHNVARCWPCYLREMDLAKPDWRELALRAEADRIKLTEPRKGETLRDYVLRHNLPHLGHLVSIIERTPGADDDLGDDDVDDPHQTTGADGNPSAQPHETPK